MDNEIFFGDDLGKVEYAYRSWLCSFPDCVEYERYGDSFCLVEGKYNHKIIMFVDLLYYYDDPVRYVKILKVIKVFNDIEQAERELESAMYEYHFGSDCLEEFR